MSKKGKGSNNVYSTMGASNHSTYVRPHSDFYATDPKAIDYLLQYEKFDKNIWECACGDGALSKRLKYYGYDVHSTDKYYYGYGEEESIDFLKQNEKFDGDIITNPPYNKVNEFILKSLELSKRKVAIFGRIQLLESKKRYDSIFSKSPPSAVYVFVRRIKCYRNGIDTMKGSAICYAWFVWDKLNDEECKIRWIYNNE